MAIALDNNLGATDGNMTSAGSLTLTTTAAAAAGTLIVVLISYFHSLNITGVTVGGSAAALDKRTTNGSDKFDVWSFQSAAGLASSSAITSSYGAGGGGILVGAASFSGLLTSSALDTTGSATGTGTSWSSGAATNTQADALYVGGSGNETGLTGTSSATSGTEIHDRWRTGDQQGFATGYKIVSTIASDSIAGTFTQSSSANTGALAIYKAAASAAVSGNRLRRWQY